MLTLLPSCRSCVDNDKSCDVMSAVVPLCPEDVLHFGLVLPDLWFFKSFWPLFGDGPWALQRGTRLAEHSLDTSCLYFGQLCVSVLSFIHFTEKCLWWVPGAAYLWVERCEVRGACATVSMWQNNSSSFIPRVSELPGHGSWPCLQHRACVSSCGVSLKSTQKGVGYPLIIRATVAIIGVSCCFVVIVPQRSHRWIRTHFLIIRI